jgi:hypothetical protein
MGRDQVKRLRLQHEALQIDFYFEKLRDPLHNWGYPIERLKKYFEDAGLTVKHVEESVKRFDSRNHPDCAQSPLPMGEGSGVRGSARATKIETLNKCLDSFSRQHSHRNFQK